MQNKIVERLKVVAEQIPQINAMWLEGSWTDGHYDELSDVDIWLDIDDESKDQVFEIIEKTLREFGELDINLDLCSQHSHLEHRVYHIEGMSKYQTFDINLQLHSRDFVFVKGIHDGIKVLLDKDNTICWQEHDEQRIEKELDERTRYSKQKFTVGQIYTQKQIERGLYIEAYSYYLEWCLKPLVEVLRIKHCPNKADFWTKHIERDLPKEVFNELELMFKVTTLEDIERNINKAAGLIR